MPQMSCRHTYTHVFLFFFLFRFASVGVFLRPFFARLPLSTSRGICICRYTRRADVVSSSVAPPAIRIKVSAGILPGHAVLRRAVRRAQPSATAAADDEPEHAYKRHIPAHYGRGGGLHARGRRHYTRARAEARLGHNDHRRKYLSAK